MSSGSGLFNETAEQARFIEGKGGVPGEVNDLRNDVLRNLRPLGAFTVAEYTNPVATAANNLKVATATVAAIVVLTAADLLAPALASMLDAPRQIVFTTAGVTAAHAPANAVIKGLDPRGVLISETLALAQTATTATTLNFFSKINSITYPAADGTAATIAIGVGAKLGLFYTPKARGGAFLVLIEKEGTAAAVTAGTITAPVAATSDLPYGSYTPNSALNGALDFTLAYEFNPATSAL